MSSHKIRLAAETLTVFLYRFILESSYEHHVSRKSVKITYNCRHCGLCLCFFNRCNLLRHIRSHSFKTATINVTDLRVEPLPLTFFKMNALPTSSNCVASLPSSSSAQTEANQRGQKNNSSSICFECKKDISGTGTIYKDRAKHYTAYTNEVHSCPVCMFAMPTVCGLKAHMRLHLKCPPYYCPECGVSLPNRGTFYPYYHDCEGFKMMRATARQKCPIPECHIFHPNEFRDHLKNNHLKKVFKCPFCFVACFTDSIMEKHLKTHKSDGKVLIFYQCEMCPGRLVLHNQIDNHLKGHISVNMYPCWACGTVMRNIPALIEHHIDRHELDSELFRNTFGSMTKETGKELVQRKIPKPKRIYRVVKRCDQCKRSFIYKCKFDQIKVLPNECPYNCCSSGSRARLSTETSFDAQITCHMCNNKISQNWEHIKEHYAAHHQQHQCIDIKVIVTKMDIDKYTNKKGSKKVLRFNMKKRGSRTRKREIRDNSTFIEDSSVDLATTNSKATNSQFACNICGHECKSKENLEEHLISHRDPCMAYQCMECGQCFVVKPSFATHLLLEHNISDAQEYISTKQCYNENALMKYHTGTNEPLRENQCRICRDQFENSDDLEKHFRVHGMAFLMKNNSNKNSP